MKLEGYFGDGAATEVEVGRIEREGWADPETLGLSLSEGKQLTAAIQTEMVPDESIDEGRAFPMLWPLRGAPGEEKINKLKRRGPSWGPGVVGARAIPRAS